MDLALYEYVIVFAFEANERVFLSTCIIHQESG